MILLLSGFCFECVDGSQHCMSLDASGYRESVTVNWLGLVIMFFSSCWLTLATAFEHLEATGLGACKYLYAYYTRCGSTRAWPGIQNVYRLMQYSLSLEASGRISTAQSERGLSALTGSWFT